MSNTNYTLNNITTHPSYSAIEREVTEALQSPNFDPEDGVFNIITSHLGHEPEFNLYETFSMSLNLA